MKKLFHTIIALIIWPITLVVFGIAATIFLLFISIISPKKLPWLTRLICRSMLLGAGQILIKKGNVPDPKNGPHLYLFNHQSYLDPFILGATSKEYITAVGGDFQFDWPLWGTVIKRYGAIPIVRENLSEAIHSLSLAEDAIKKGTSFIISPEGKRTHNGKMLPFKKGPFHVSLNTGVTIVPVGIRGAFDAYNRTDWKIKPGIISVHYGKPINHNKYKNMTIEELRDYVYKEIAELCDDNAVKEYKNDE